METWGRVTCLLMAVSCVLWAPTTRAQDAESAPIGDGASALPSLVRVPVAGALATGLVVAGHAGYGFTEGVLGEDDTHHRLSGALAASVRPLAWLGVALRLDGHYDAHSSATGADDGMVGEARLLARATFGLSSRLAVGIEGVLFVPGGEAPSLDFSATTVDAKALASWSLSSRFVLALTAGARLDRTAHAALRHAQWSRADTLSLGASDSDALLFGVGASWRASSLELVAEATADVLIGALAPSFAQSPLRVAAGARVSLSKRLTLSLLAEGTLSARPSLASTAPLVPVEPRVSLVVGLVGRALSARTPTERAESELAERRPIVDPSTPSHDARTGVEPARPEGASPAGVIRGLVRSGEHGVGLPGARVAVEPGGLSARTDERGQFEIEVPPGNYDVLIDARGHESQHTRAVVERLGVTVLNVDLRGGL